MQFDQSKNPNYVLAQAARRRRAASPTSSASRTSARRRRTTPTTSSRASARVWDVRGNGKDVIRGGWGIYTDFGYTNSNVLFPAADASGIGVRHGLHREQHRPGITQSRRQLLPRRPAADQHRGAERGRRRAAALRPVDRPAPRAAGYAADVGRLVARADGQHGGRRPTTSTSTAAS